MKKVLVVLTAFMLLLGCAGCGQSGTDKADAKGVSKEDKPVIKDLGENISNVWYTADKSVRMTLKDDGTGDVDGYPVSYTVDSKSGVFVLKDYGTDDFYPLIEGLAVIEGDTLQIRTSDIYKDVYWFYTESKVDSLVNSKYSDIYAEKDFEGFEDEKSGRGICFYHDFKKGVYNCVDYDYTAEYLYEESKKARAIAKEEILPYYEKSVHSDYEVKLGCDVALIIEDELYFGFTLYRYDPDNGYLFKEPSFAIKVDDRTILEEIETSMQVYDYWDGNVVSTPIFE